MISVVALTTFSAGVTVISRQFFPLTKQPFCCLLSYFFEAVNLYFLMLFHFYFLQIWEVYNERRCIRTYSGHKQAVRDITFNNSGKEFLSCGYDRYIKLWDTETGEEVQTPHHNGGPKCRIHSILTMVEWGKTSIVAH